MTNQFRTPQPQSTGTGSLTPLVQALDKLVNDQTLPRLILTDETVAEIREFFTINPLVGPGTADDA